MDHGAFCRRENTQLSLIAKYFVDINTAHFLIAKHINLIDMCALCTPFKTRLAAPQSLSLLIALYRSISFSIALSLSRKPDRSNSFPLTTALFYP